MVDQLLVGSPSSESCSSVMSKSIVVSLMNRDGIGMVVHSSNGSGSLIKYKPLSGVVWLMVLDSESVCMGVDLLVVEKSSASWKLRSQLEFLAVFHWVIFVGQTFLFEGPSLSLSIRAFLI